MSVCGALTGLALFACLARDPVCLPPAHAHLREDLAAIMLQESGGRPNALRDEATGESLFPATRADAERIAAGRDAAGHPVGAGLFQITGRRNWARHGLTVATVFDPCANLRAGAAHYAADLRDEVARLRAGALSRYNSGRHDGSPAYAAAVTRRIAAGVGAPPPVPGRVPLAPRFLSAPAATVEVLLPLHAGPIPATTQEALR